MAEKGPKEPKVIDVNSLDASEVKNLRDLIDN